MRQQALDSDPVGKVSISHAPRPSRFLQLGPELAWVVKKQTFYCKAFL